MQCEAIYWILVSEHCLSTLNKMRTETMSKISDCTTTLQHRLFPTDLNPQGTPFSDSAESDCWVSNRHPVLCSCPCVCVCFSIWRDQCMFRVSVWVNSGESLCMCTQVITHYRRIVNPADNHWLLSKQIPQGQPITRHHTGGMDTYCCLPVTVNLSVSASCSWSVGGLDRHIDLMCGFIGNLLLIVLVVE